MVIHSLFFGGDRLWTQEVTGWAYFLSGVFFLNAIHVLFTYKMILFFPEFKNFRMAQKAESRISFEVECLAVFAITFCFFRFFSLTLDQHTWFGLSATVNVVFSLYHFFRQFEGISLNYDRELIHKGDTKLKESLQTGRLREKSLFLILVSVVSLNAFFGMIFFYSNPQLATTVRHLSLAISAVVCFLVVIQSFMITGVSSKSLYLSRLFYIPLMFVSLPAVLALTSIHGIEYYFVYRHMKKQSAVKETLASKSFLILSVPLAILVLLTMPFGAGLGWIWDPKIPQDYPFFYWVSSFGTALSVTHYYLDWKIFRFRNSLPRTYLAPLLSQFLAPSPERKDS